MSSVLDPTARALAMWRYHGQERPPFADPPGPGQESVWDYPRPPRIEADPREVLIRVGDVEIARTTRAVRVLETASPPTYYLPEEDVLAGALHAARGASSCEWKGSARYLTVVAGGLRFDRSAWTYPQPLPAFDRLRGHVGFYAKPFECFVGGRAVLPQPGMFYAGWITPEVVGPFKGDVGSAGW